MREYKVLNGECTKTQMENFIQDFYDGWKIFSFIEEQDGAVTEVIIVKDQSLH